MVLSYNDIKLNLFNNNVHIIDHFNSVHIKYCFYFHKRFLVYDIKNDIYCLFEIKNIESDNNSYEQYTFLNKRLKDNFCEYFNRLIENIDSIDDILNYHLITRDLSFCDIDKFIKSINKLK